MGALIAAGPMEPTGARKGVQEDMSSLWPKVQTARPPTSKTNSSRKRRADRQESAAELFGLRGLRHMSQAVPQRSGIMLSNSRMYGDLR